MDYKNIWTEADFTDMGRHDAVLYSMSFPQADCVVRFDIDYIFKWHWDSGAATGWDIAPCTLEFNGISNLKLSLDWQMQGDTSIQNIARNNCRLSPNGKFTVWDYQIELDIGDLSFTSTGFTQALRSRPIFSASQSLGRLR